MEIDWRANQRIDADLESVFYQSWDDAGEKRAIQFEARIAVALDQPRVEFLIDHEIQTKQLKVMLFVVWVQSSCTGSDGICGHLLQFRVDILKETMPALIFFLEVAFEILIGYFVAFFEAAIVR